MRPVIRHSKRIATAISGGAVVLVGFVLIPYPGPGWLIVFAGFAILATEFVFAARALEWLKNRYEHWKQWVIRQPKVFQLILLVGTGLVVLMTAYLLNTFGVVGRLLGIDVGWLASPLFG